MKFMQQIVAILAGLLIVDLATASNSLGEEVEGRSLRGDDQQRRRLPVFSVIQGMLNAIDETATISYRGQCNINNGIICRACEGDCDTDADCRGKLRCYQRLYPWQHVPGCIGSEEEESTYDICYMPPEDAGPDLLVNGGGGLCEGDCNDDDDCDDDLKCFQRHYAFTDVPGCYDGKFHENRYDFCYQPPPPSEDEVAVTDCDSENPCPKCRGDCDDDDDCEGDLECFYREEIYMPVPGCRNGHDFEDPTNFCYDPKDDIVVKEIGCDPDDLCDKCRGHCDSDDDCMQGLKCSQRDIPYQLVPGCLMGTDKSTNDYCYNPDDEEDQDSRSDLPDQEDWRDSYFNYDLNDKKFGPAGWKDVDVDDNEWERFDLDLDDNECDGDEQSPIDLNTANTKCKETHHIYYLRGNEEEMNDEDLTEYAITPFRLRVNFEKVKGIDPPQIDPPGGIAGGITAKDASHVEYMEPSEHTIGGQRFDGEYRIMHAQKNFDTIIGVAVMVESGHGPNHHWEVILRKWERVNNCGNGKGRNFDMQYLEFYYPITSMYFWAYEGSLTEPPCSQVVQWRVVDTPIKISNEQKERTRKLLNEGGPCKDHPLRKSPRQNGGARPIQRDANDAKVWRCTVEDFYWDNFGSRIVPP